MDKIAAPLRGSGVVEIFAKCSLIRDNDVQSITVARSYRLDGANNFIIAHNQSFWRWLLEAITQLML